MTNGTGVSHDGQYHITSSEGLLDTLDFLPKGRPLGEILPQIRGLVESYDIILPHVVERSHDPRGQINGLIGLLRNKELRRDPRGFDTLVELLRECVGYQLREATPSILPGWLGKKPTPETEECEDHSHSTYVIDKCGQFWKWNMGWWVWDVKKRKPKSIRPIGHLAFRKIPKATRLELNVRTITMGAKPYGEWRRWVADHTIGKPTLYFHEVYKHVKVLCTDGVHAIVQNYYDPEQPRHEVMFKNLNELRMAETKLSMESIDKRKGKKPSSPKASPILVEVTDDFLKTLLD
jgi:hypothetical protein